MLQRTLRTVPTALLLRRRCFILLPRIFASSTAAAKDPYRVLGLQRGASDAEVKTRYRELAKQFHPDLNPGDEKAATRMAEVSEAYQLLCDKEQKAFFDQHGFTREDAPKYDPGNIFRDFTGFADFFNSAWHQPAVARVTLEFMEAAKGCTKTIAVKFAQVCKICSGTGAASHAGTKACPACRGRGVTRIQQGPLLYEGTCHRCGGKGVVPKEVCRTCSGAGTVEKPAEVKVNFPAGIRDETELRVNLQEPESPGDIVVRVSVKPHQTFKPLGDDIVVEVPVTFGLCVLGGQISVPTLEGPTTVKIPPGTVPGTTKILSRKGLQRPIYGGRGDLLARLSLVMPGPLSARQRSLVEEFERLEECKKNNGGSSPQSGSKSETREPSGDSSGKEKSGSSRWPFSGLFG